MATMLPGAAEKLSAATRARGGTRCTSAFTVVDRMRGRSSEVRVRASRASTVPFSQRFGKVGDFEKDAYFVSLLATLVGTVLLIAPSAYHRLRWREVSDEEILRISNRLAIAGSLFLAVAMTSAVLLVTDVLFSGSTTAVVTAATAGLFAWFWFGLPLTRLQRKRSR